MSATKSWTELSKLEKSIVISILAVPLLCCIGIAANLGDDADEPSSSIEEPSATETSASPSPSLSPSPSESATPTEAAEPSTSAPPPPPPSTEAATSEAVATVYYENCTAAWDAGAAPLSRNDPGYRAGLDRDGDGNACESKPSSGGNSGSSGDSGGSSGGDSGGSSGDDESESSVYYKNCDAVRAAGAAPIYAGQPGYAKHLDRDGDGVGCE